MLSKLKILPLSCILVFLIMSCGDNSDSQETPSGMNGNWRLTEITVNLDGNELVTISPTGFQTTFNNSSFSYSDDGQKNGTWSIDDTGNNLTVNFGSTMSVFPIISQTDSEIIFNVKTVDLSGALSEEEIALSRLVNQKLNESGTNWRIATSGGQSLNVIFTLSKF